MESRQPGIWAACLVTYVAALVAFLLRLAARRLKRLPLYYDDYLALVAFLFTTAFTVINLYKLRFGFGLRSKDIGRSDDQISYDYFRLLWLDSWFYTFGIGLSKLAVLAFYWKIFGHSNIRLPIQLLSGCVIGWIVARVVVIPLQCIPIKKYWDHNAHGVCPVKTNLFFFGTTFPHLLMEIAIVILPILKIRQLNLPRAQRIAVSGMFASGTVVCVASIIQLVEAFELNTSSKDLWWTAAPQLMCAVIEVNLGHFSTSLPNLRPILDIVVGRTPTNSSRPSVPYGPSIKLSSNPVIASDAQRSDTYCKI